MKKLVGMLAGTILLVGGGLAQANSFTYGSVTQNIGVATPSSVGIITPISRTVSAGEIQLNGTGANAGQTLDVWCIDLLDTLFGGGDSFTITPLTTAGAGHSNPALTALQISEMGSLMIHGTSDVFTDADHNADAAFQLAIWSVEYGGTLLDNASGALATLVATLDARVAPGGIWYCPGCSVDMLQGGSTNQVLAFGVSPTPLPAALPLFATGLGALGLLGWRRKRKAQLAA